MNGISSGGITTKGRIMSWSSCSRMWQWYIYRPAKASKRVLVVTAGWTAGWLWSGSTAWPEAFWSLAHEYVPTLGDLLSGASFLPLAAGGAMSGIVGGILMYLLLRPTATTRSM